MVRNLGGIVCASAAVLALGATANAQGLGTAIAPGGQVNFSSTNTPGIPSGTEVAEISSTFNATGGGGTVIAGTYISEVYKEAGGTYDFYYQFTNGGTSTGPIASFGVSNFAPVSSSVGETNAAVGTTQTGPPLLTTPTAASSYTSGGPGFVSETNGSIDSMIFDFTNLNNNGVVAGATSVTMLVSTNSTNFTVSNGTFQGSVAANANVYAPASTTVAPEPASLALIVPGLLGLAGMVRRRKVA